MSLFVDPPDARSKTDQAGSAASKTRLHFLCPLRNAAGQQGTGCSLAGRWLPFSCAGWPYLGVSLGSSDVFTFFSLPLYLRSFYPSPFLTPSSRRYSTQLRAQKLSTTFVRNREYIHYHASRVISHLAKHSRTTSIAILIRPASVLGEQRVPLTRHNCRKATRILSLHASKLIHAIIIQFE